jgi:hypothetical protein
MNFNSFIQPEAENEQGRLFQPYHPPQFSTYISVKIFSNSVPGIISFPVPQFRIFLFHPIILKLVQGIYLSNLF